MCGYRFYLNLNFKQVICGKMCFACSQLMKCALPKDDDVTQGGCGCPAPGCIQGQAGCGSGQPGLVVGNPDCGRAVGSRLSLRSFSTQTVV